MCDEYLVFLTARRIITTLLLDEIYLLQLGFDWNSDRCLIADVTYGILIYHYHLSITSAWTNQVS